MPSLGAALRVPVPVIVPTNRSAARPLDGLLLDSVVLFKPDRVLDRLAPGDGIVGRKAGQAGLLECVEQGTGRPVAGDGHADRVVADLVAEPSQLLGRVDWRPDPVT